MPIEDAYQLLVRTVGYKRFTVADLRESTVDELCELVEIEADTGLGQRTKSEFWLSSNPEWVAALVRGTDATGVYRMASQGAGFRAGARRPR